MAIELWNYLNCSAIATVDLILTWLNITIFFFHRLTAILAMFPLLFTFFSSTKVLMYLQYNLLGFFSLLFLFGQWPLEQISAILWMCNRRHGNVIYCFWIQKLQIQNCVNEFHFHFLVLFLAFTLCFMCASNRRSTWIYFRFYFILQFSWN